MFNNKERIEKIIKQLSDNLEERKEIVAISLLGTLIGESVFLYGPPGTGKSLISRRISKAFNEQVYFEYLMNKFSSPDEIFGQISISELKKDNYKRLIDGFLPTANFVFLDEIWKSSPAILNTLLTILNERIFKNGKEIVKVPIKAVITASNETPPKNQGLEALYDRFLLRVNVPPISKKNNFEKLLKNENISDEIEISEELMISNNDIERWKRTIHKVDLPKECLNIIHTLRTDLYEKKEDLDIYVSDRRWKKIAYLLKASAFFCDRLEVNVSDLFLLKYCLWSTEENREKIDKLIIQNIEENSYIYNIKLTDFDKKKESLENEINEILYSTKNEISSPIVDILGNKYFLYKNKKTEIYIDASKLGTSIDFNPVDKHGTIVNYIKCNFLGSEICHIDIDRNSLVPFHLQNNLKFLPVTYNPTKKITVKREISFKLIEYLNENVTECITDCNEMIKKLEHHLENLKNDLDNIFILDKNIDVATKNIKNLLKEVKLRKEDCMRIKNLILS